MNAPFVTPRVDHQPSPTVAAFLARDHGLMIGDAFAPALEGRRFETRDPSTAGFCGA